MNKAILFPLKVLLIAIDFAITLLTFGWIGILKHLFQAEPVRSVPVNDDPAHRVDPRFKNNLATTPREGLFTLYDLCMDSFKKFGNIKCMGSRKFIGWKTPNKVKEFGDIQWRTFDQVSVQAHKFGAALRAVGLKPAPDKTTIDKVNSPCRIAIFENTCADWMVACIGAITQSISVVTVYATLGTDAVVEAVVDNSVKVMVCNKKDVAKLAEKADKMPTLTHLVYTNDIVGVDEKIDLPKPPKNMKILSIDEFIASGDEKAFPPTPPKPETCAVVMYTSGSTGKPKGVIITHSQIVACCASADIALGIRRGEDVYLAYLPCAHILELMAEFVMITQGCTLCYADPKSLTSTGAYPTGAFEAYSPTLMAAVPKIWEVIKKGIVLKVAAMSPIKQFLFETAFEWRLFCLKHGFDAPLFNLLVFKKLKAAVGGRLRLGISGGGPLNTQVQDFCRTAFGFILSQGYGLTETNAGLTIQALDDMRGGIAGQLIPSVEVKLVSTPEVGDRAGQAYLSSDRYDVEGNPIFGRGEICVRGPNITTGYYMMPEQTKEVFTDDGWFYTGDIGQFMSDGSIRIVDRKKNLVKLKGGEYIAIERMEMTYGNSTFVDAINGGICVYGDGDMDRPVALMQLNEAAVKKWAKDNGKNGSFEELTNSKELYDAVMEDLRKEHSKSDLSHLEKLAAVALITEPWTSENGCLTAANKLQRRAIVQAHEKEFNEVKNKGIFN